MIRHLVLVGPTASGKSRLALDLAERHGSEIISMDSMQVYRGMDIGTAKPTAAERARVPHHLVDVVDPSQEWTVTDHQERVRGLLARADRPLILVGGTGLYVSAVVDDLDIPGRFPDVVAELDAEPDTAGLHRRLAELDPRAALKMEPSNRRRIVRALEVTIGSGRPFSSYGPGLGHHQPSQRFELVGLTTSRERLDEMIEARVRRMIDAGLVDEVRALAARLGRTARQALGYKELLDHVEGGADLGECVDETIRRTRRFARRQERWFRRDPRWRWLVYDVDPSEVTIDLPTAILDGDRETHLRSRAGSGQT